VVAPAASVDEFRENDDLTFLDNLKRDNWLRVERALRAPTSDTREMSVIGFEPQLVLSRWLQGSMSGFKLPSSTRNVGLLLT
jgi:hypothetical protein